MSICHHSDCTPTEATTEAYYKKLMIRDIGPGLGTVNWPAGRAERFVRKARPAVLGEAAQYQDDGGVHDTLAGQRRERCAVCTNGLHVPVCRHMPNAAARLVSRPASGRAERSARKARPAPLGEASSIRMTAVSMTRWPGSVGNGAQCARAEQLAVRHGGALALPYAESFFF